MMSKEETLVKLLCLVQTLNETLDELKDTNYYFQSFKNQTNNYEKSIVSLLSSDISKLYHCNQKAVEAIISGIEEKTKEIVELTNYELAEYKSILDTFYDTCPHPNTKMKNHGTTNNSKEV